MMGQLCRTLEEETYKRKLKIATLSHLSICAVAFAVVDCMCLFAIDRYKLGILDQC